MLRISMITCLMWATSVLAQISITKNHMPSNGDAIEYSNASPINIEYSKTGADVSWDYSDLSSIGDGEEEYTSSLKTPYLLNFGFTAVGKKLMDTLGFSDFQLKNIYNFYQTSNASYRDVGIGFQFAAFPLPQTGKHSDPDEIYLFPLEYGDKDSTTFDVEVPISVGIKLGSFIRTGTRVTTVDGWGTITTPYGKDIECIRVKSVIDEFDSMRISTPSISIGQRIKRIEYKWLSTTEEIPILMITGNEALGTFTPTSVVYRNEWSKETPIVVDFEADKTSSNSGQVISFTNKSTGDNLSYLWTIEPSTAIFVNGTSNTDSDPKVVFQKDGEYSITLKATDDNGSAETTKVDYIIIGSVSISDLSNDNISIYPNPTSNLVHIETKSPNSTIDVSIYASNGERILSQSGQQSIEMDVTNIAQGVYILEVKEGDSVYQSKLIKN